jgi:putative Mg2+ transporter-C (MgtC) family protein
MIKIILATIIGGLIGKERNKRNVNAGSRTYALVSLFGCLIALLSMKLLNDGIDFSFTRMISYTFPAIGFACSGIIWNQKDKVHGLTSAMALLCSLVVGTLIGLGYYGTAILTSIVIYILLEMKYFGGGNGK